jgi:peptidoglycan/xylan/chitin deacetylase (PgdA/CDA1 family)
MQKTTKEGKKFELITSWDDGTIGDLDLAEMLRAHHLPGIFYVPSNSCELTKGDISGLSKHFDIGGHTVNHQILRGLRPDLAYCELKESKEYLEKLIGREITSLCYPKGRYDKDVIEIVKDLGYKEARTVKVLNLFTPTNPFEIETSVHVYNRKEYSGVYWLDMALDLFDKVIESSSTYNYFHLWGHSWEISKFDYWEDLEVLFRYMESKIE